MNERAQAADEVDVAILGAGPAGAAAAVEAMSLGLRTTVLDEQAAAGGQVHRVAPGIGPVRPDADRAEGDALRAELRRSGAECRFGRRVWHLERDGERWLVHALAESPEPGSSQVPEVVAARALVIATGAVERHLPFEGWDRPGVIGLAAATALLKSQRVLPGREVLVAGAGPLLLVVAKAIVEGGGRVVAVVDAHRRMDWFASARDVVSRPDLVAKGLGWRRSLASRGVPVLHGHRLQSVDGDAPNLRATVVAVERDGASKRGAPAIGFACDAVCVGYGLLPATDATRLAGAAHRYDSRRGTWQAIVDDDQRTGVPRLYVAGDGAGIDGAAAAPWAGRVAACTAALDLGRLDVAAHGRRTAAAKRSHERAARFGSAMARLADIGDGAHAAIAPATIVCQCERIERAAIDAAIDAGCTTLNDLRAATRCGMGPCGGRLCEDAIARLAVLRSGHTRTEIGQPTGRPPLRPVDLDTLAGAFDYASLPMATPAPL
jgi:thioredoxin reductase/bacterioferritin-associated ferredoxin